MRHFKKQRLLALCIEGQGARYRPANHNAEPAAVNPLSKKTRLPGRVLIFAPLR